MSRRLTSPIWHHFHRKGIKLAECAYCKKGISTSNGSFSNLRRHLRSKHPTVPLQSKSKDSVALGPEELTEMQDVTIKTDEDSETYEDTPLNESDIAACGRIEDPFKNIDRTVMSECEEEMSDTVTRTHPQTRKRRTSVWMHFVKNGPNRAECTYCKTVISFSNGSTSNLRRHLKSKHPTVGIDSQRSNGIVLGLEDCSREVPEITAIHAITIKTDEETETYEDTPINDSLSEITATPSYGSISDGFQHLDRNAMRTCKEEIPDSVPGTDPLITKIKAPRRTSKIWRFFIKKGGNRAECTYCKAILSTTGGSFSNLRRHFKGKHPTVSLESRNSDVVALGLEDSSPEVPELPEIQAVTLRNFGEPETYEDLPTNESQSETLETATRGPIADTFHHHDRIPKTACEEKEFEEFGRFVAAELRRVPRRQALLLQKEIQDAIFNVRMRAFE